MRGLVGAVMAVGLLVGCGGVEADVDAQGTHLEEQRQALVPCRMLERGSCSGASTYTYCINDAGKKLYCSCTDMGTWSCVE